MEACGCPRRQGAILWGALQAIIPTSPLAWRYPEQLALVVRDCECMKAGVN